MRRHVAFILAHKISMLKRAVPLPVRFLQRPKQSMGAKFALIGHSERDERFLLNLIR